MRAPPRHTPGEYCPSIAGDFPDLEATTPSFGVLVDELVKKPPRKERGHDGQYGCRVPVDGTKRCPQCWEVKAHPAEFFPPGARHANLNCTECLDKPREPR
jgi:hypothetical protein